MKRHIVVGLSFLLTLPGNNGLAYRDKALGPSYSDFGGIGLLQMPNARMSEEGTLGLSANRTSPYSRYSMTFQPFPWMEANLLYTSVSGVPYDATGTFSDRDYLDKSLDVKFRLVKESRYMPELAVGLRDLAGTGFFSSEYFVANKRFGSFDFTLGVGWGYMGAREHASNPFSFISDSYKTRRDILINFASSGDFNEINYFRGPVALFGGIEYQTPYRPLRLKLEYDSNDYSAEPNGAPVAKSSSPINFGLVYRLGKNVDLTLGYERGDEVIFGISWSNNLKKLKSTDKYNLTYQAVINPALVPHSAPINWQPVIKDLEVAGMTVERIYLGEQEITVYAEYSKSYHHAELVGLASRILANHLPANILVFNFVERKSGLSINEITVRRDHFTAATSGRLSAKELAYSTEQLETYNKFDSLAYKAPSRRFNYSLSPGLRIHYGGPDSVLLYQAMANLNASYRFMPGLELSGQASLGLFDNYDKFVYDGPAGTGVALPRVRTFVRDYVKGSDTWIDNLQLTYTKRLGRDWFGMAYGGLLEMMYGGVGAELLYRPHGSNLALSLDINYVKQREFKRHFGFRDYEAATGHLTLYYHWEKQNVLIKASVGQYLAEDKGVTLDISRKFKNGVIAGVFTTRTNVSEEDFGEGSFDKGLYIEVPFDYLTPIRSNKSASFFWRPVTRDGGAKLNRKYSLHSITQSRDLTDLLGGIDTMVGPVSEFK